MNCATEATASTLVVGVASTQIRLATKALASVVVMRAVGWVAVPTATSPTEPAEGVALADAEGERLADGLREADGDNDALAELEGERLDDGLKLGLTEAEAELDGDNEAEAERELELEGDSDGERESEAEGELETETEAELDGERLAEGDSEGEVDELGEPDDEGDSEADTEALELDDGEIDADGEIEADAAPGAVMILPNNLTKTAPVTVNRVATPTAPAPVLPVKVILLVSWTDQSTLVTLAPFLFICWAIFISFYFFIKNSIKLH